MTTETLSLTELRPRLPELVDRVSQFFDRFFITRHGRTEAVLLAVDDFAPDELRRQASAPAPARNEAPRKAAKSKAAPKTVTKKSTKKKPAKKKASKKKKAG